MKAGILASSLLMLALVGCSPKEPVVEPTAQMPAESAAAPAGDVRLVKLTLPGMT